MNTHDTNLGLLFGNFIHTQENSDVGYLFLIGQSKNQMKNGNNILMMEKKLSLK